MPLPEDVETVQLPGLPEYEGEVSTSAKIFVYDDADNKLKQASISQLPFGEGGGGTVLPATIIVDSNSDSMTTVVRVEDDGDHTDTVITDARLVGAGLYSVRTTQLNNAAFRFDELIYDADNGKCTIKDFVLGDDELIIIDAPGAASSNPDGSSYSQLLADVAFLKLLTAPFKPNVLGPSKCFVWFTGTSEELAETMPGWAIVDGWAGKTPIVVDPEDASIDAVNKTTGEKSKKLTVNMIPEMNPANGDYKYLLRKSPVGVNCTSKYTDATLSGTEPDVLSIQEVKKVGTAVADQAELSLMQPVKAGFWIQFVGV